MMMMTVTIMIMVVMMMMIMMMMLMMTEAVGKRCFSIYWSADDSESGSSVVKIYVATHTQRKLSDTGLVSLL